MKDNASSSETLLSFDEWVINKEISIPENSTREYKLLKNQYLKYQEKFISGIGSSQYENYQVYKEDFLEKASQEYEGYEVYKEPFIKEQKALSSQKKQQDQKYLQYLDDVDNRNSLKTGRAIVSPFVMGYGLAVIASASLSSAVLAIERNSRDKK